MMKQYIFKNKQQTFKFFSLLFCFTLLFQPLSAQQFAIDYTPTKERESSFKVGLFKQGIIGLNSLQHIDASAEVLRMQFDSSGGTILSLSLFSTQTIWAGNKKDELNLLSYIHNPVGGIVNGSFMGKIPLSFQKNTSYKLGVRLGLRLIEGFPLDPTKSRFFVDNYASLGVIYQRLLFEDARKNQSLYLLAYPSGILHYSGAEKREQFFNNQLETTAYGYGFQLGVELNRSFRFSFMGHQLLNAEEGSDVGRFVLRFSTGYSF